jgi:hypothetical protein
MLRFSNRPRRPRPKAETKAAGRQMPKWRRWLSSPRLRDAAMLALTLVTATRLVSAAVAHPPPVATPGDIVPISRVASWMSSVNHVNARNLSNAFAQPGSVCTLQIGRMARHGGDLTVLAVRPDGVMLSWAGGPTAAPGEACAGGETGILVSDADYRSLLMRASVRR